jgi:antitoxin CcdA
MDRKRAVNLTLSEEIVSQAEHYTSNLSATVEKLLATYVADQRAARDSQMQKAQACAADWNAVHDSVGSFSDDHVNL